MKTALVQVRVDDKTKKQVDELFTSLGMDTATAVRLFLVQALQIGGLPFSIMKQRPYNATTDAAIEEALAIAEDRTEAESFSSFQEFCDSTEL